MDGISFCSKAVKVKAVVKEKAKISNQFKDSKFKRVVIDDSDDEAICSVNKEESDKIKKGKEDTFYGNNGMYRQEPSQDINISVNSVPDELNNHSPFMNGFTGECFQVREGIESCDKEVGISRSAHDVLNSQNEAILENLEDGKSIKELVKVFNEQVKVNFLRPDEPKYGNCGVNGMAVTVNYPRDSSIKDLGHSIIKTDDDNKYFPAASNGNNVPVREGNLNAKEVMANDVKDVTVPEEKIEVPRKNQEINITQGKALNTMENDVIAKRFKTGDRQHAWESLKAKKQVPSRKKVIFPVVVKDYVTRRDEFPNEDQVTDETVKTPVDPVVSPLMEFQIALEKQIKDLVTTLQDLHTVEKNAILDKISQKQESTNKQTLESIIDLLIDKKMKLEAGLPVPPKRSPDNDINMKKVCTFKHKPEDTSTHSSKQICKGSLDNGDPSKESNMFHSNDNLLISNGGCKEVKDNPSSLKKPKMNRDIRLKKKNAPLVSILKTPVRRKKPPLPFSETVHNGDGVDVKADDTPLPSTECGYALLHEILKDCSSTNVSVEQHPLSPERGISEVISRADLVTGVTEINEDGCNAILCSKGGSTDNTPLSSHMKEGCAYSLVNEQETLPTVNDGIIKSEVLGNCSPPTKSKCGLGISITGTSENVNCGNVLGAMKGGLKIPIPSLNLKYDVTPKQSLDERLQKLRENFINSENRWLYEPEREPRGSDNCLQNAGRVLKEVQVTKNFLEKNENFKYTDMLQYFDANPYLIEPDVARIKKNIDDNITLMTIDIQKKINNKPKRSSLKEKNDCVPKLK